MKFVPFPNLNPTRLFTGCVDGAHRPGRIWVQCIVLVVLGCVGSGVSAEVNRAEIDNLEPNRWHLLHEDTGADWHRQQHAGIALDTLRSRLLVFGSDTHGRNWDNAVRAFDLRKRQWTTLHPAAGPDTYRVNTSDVATAGSDGEQPWAMHTFDTVVYDPSHDTLVVAAAPLHNPKRSKKDGRVKHPTWMYDLARGAWSTVESPTNFFGGSAAYDTKRDVVVAYRNGLWELGPERRQWRKIRAGVHHSIHHSMVYDSRRHQLVVFGERGGKKDEIWTYSPSDETGGKGTWTRVVPRGDGCPPDQHFPVAYSASADRFLMVLDVRGESGSRKAVTCSFDPETHKIMRLPGTDLPMQKMNYMMEYDSGSDAFYLVTGRHSRPTRVWVLRLTKEAGEK